VEKEWWAFDPDSSWVTKGSTNQYFTREVFSEGAIKQEEVFNLFQEMVGNAPGLKQVIAVYNPILAHGFESYLKTLEGKMKASKMLFQQDDWKNEKNAQRRGEFLDYYQKNAKKYPWNKEREGKLLLVPLIQGTSEAAAWNITENGFGVVAKLDDGYFGKGIYFTSTFDYAAKYVIYHVESNPSHWKAFIISLVVPGNVFPVTENPFRTDTSGRILQNPNGTPMLNLNGYYGKGIRAGYQSHFTIVPKAEKNAFPIRGNIESDNDATELVVFQEAQTLPLFVFFTD